MRFKWALSFVLLLLATPLALVAQVNTQFSVPDSWEAGGPPATSTTLDDSGEYRLYRENISLAGTASGRVGRFLGRVASVAGISDFMLTVTLHERVEPREPGLRLDTEIVLRELPEKVPEDGGLTFLSGQESVIYFGYGQPDRKPAGEELVEATYSGYTVQGAALKNWIELLSGDAVEGVFSGRPFRITGGDLQRLRNQVLAVVQPGAVYDFARLSVPIADREVLGDRHSAPAPLSDDRLFAMTAERLQGVPTNLPLNFEALAEIVPVTRATSNRQGLASDDAQVFAIFQNVKVEESVPDLLALDWRPMAAPGDTLYLVDGPEPDAPVVVRRRYAVRDLQGGCTASIPSTGWLYEVEFAAGAGQFPSTKLGRRALARPVNGRTVTPEQEPIPLSLAPVIHADIREALGANRGYRPGYLEDGLKTFTLRASGRTFSFWSATLASPNSDWVSPIVRTYIMDEEGTVVQRLEYYPYDDVLILDPNRGGDEEVLLQTGTIRFLNGQWLLPEVKPFSYGIC